MKVHLCRVGIPDSGLISSLTISIVSTMLKEDGRRMRGFLELHDSPRTGPETGTPKRTSELPNNRWIISLIPPRHSQYPGCRRLSTRVFFSYLSINVEVGFSLHFEFAGLIILCATQNPGTGRMSSHADLDHATLSSAAIALEVDPTFGKNNETA
jgi:hypothetical protein